MVPVRRRWVLPVEDALPVLAQGPQPDVLLQLVMALVGVVAPAPLGGADMDSARSPVPGAGVGTGESASRRFPAGLPAACEVGPPHVGHDVDQGAAVNGPCRTRDRARLSLDVKGLGGRMHQCASRRLGVEPAHAVGWSAQQAYARWDLIAERRELLDQWVTFMTN